MGAIITKNKLRRICMLKDENDFYFTDGYSLTLEQFINNESPVKDTQIDVVIVEPLRQPYSTKMDNGEINMEVMKMPNIKPVSDLRSYNDVLRDCTDGELVFLTKNERGRYFGDR